MVRSGWLDKVKALPTSSLQVVFSKKDEERHIAHITVPYDQNGNRKLYVKIALTATWMRRIFAGSAFSMRRARDVANATEVMSDAQTVAATVAMIEELCRFHAHDSESQRRFTSPCVAEAQTPTAGFDMLEPSEDGTLFAVSLGRATGTKVHVYTGKGEGNHHVVVLGAVDSVTRAIEAIQKMFEAVKTGVDHSEARAATLASLNNPKPASEAGDGSSCLDEQELPLESSETESSSLGLDVNIPVTVLRRHMTILTEKPNWSMLTETPQPESGLDIKTEHSHHHLVNSINARAFVPRMMPPHPMMHMMFTCRGCGIYPRRVAFHPCSHLALCLVCSDVHARARAPCLICGAAVVNRQVYFLE